MSGNKRIRAGLAAVITTMIAIGQVNANLVTNGGFETGDLTGWTEGGNTGFTGVAGNPHSGNDAVFAGPVGSDGNIHQTLATAAGGLYDLDYWFEPDGGRTSDFSVQWGGATIPGSLLTNPPASGYIHFHFLETATGPSTVLQFSLRDDPGFLFLDDISVNATVPEPVTAGLGLISLAGLGLAALRRRHV